MVEYSGSSALFQSSPPPPLIYGAKAHMPMAHIQDI